MCVFGCEIGANSIVGRYCVANSGPFCWIDYVRVFGLDDSCAEKFSPFKGFGLVFMVL
jgi:hypothetical protein